MKIKKHFSIPILILTSAMSLNASAGSCFFESYFYPANEDRNRRADELTNDIRRDMAETNIRVGEYLRISQEIDERLKYLKDKFGITTERQEMYKYFTFPDRMIDGTKYGVYMIFGAKIASKTWKALERPIASKLLSLYGKEALKTQYRTLSTSAIRSLFLKNANLGRAFKFLKFGGKAVGSIGATAVITVGVDAAVCAATGAARREKLRGAIDEGVFQRVISRYEYELLDKVVDQLDIVNKSFHSVIQIFETPGINLSQEQMENAVYSALQSAETEFTKAVNKVTLQESKDVLNSLDNTRNSWTAGDPNLEINCPELDTRLFSDSGWGMGDNYQKTVISDTQAIKAGGSVVYGCFNGGGTASGAKTLEARCSYDPNNLGSTRWQYDDIENCHGLKSTNDGSKIWLRPHGEARYVRALGGGNGNIDLSDRGDVWERFELIDINKGQLISGDKVLLKTFDGSHYVMAQNGGGGEVHTRSTNQGGWETFTIYHMNDRDGAKKHQIFNTYDVLFKTDNGHYLRVENNSLKANASSSQQATVFRLAQQTYHVRKSDLLARPVLWQSHTAQVPSNQCKFETAFNSSVLRVGDSISSSDGRFTLKMEDSGNLGIYNSQHARIWGTSIQGEKPEITYMQSDGNLVLYTPNAPAWASHTWGRPNASLVMECSGNLVIYDDLKDYKLVSGI